MSSNWWANKLGTPAPQQPQRQGVVQPQPATYAQSPQPQYPPTQQMTPQAERCPGCGSNNYGGATPESRKRCYDCGYPIVQSGSGMGKGIVSGQGSAGPAQASRQVQSGGWNPGVIIGKIE
jgi:hypothetical protein